MKLTEIVTWYQKKIGTYDRQQWENTVEQKILDGFSSVTLKTAKLKTELIDVDLVRGSTFPKAKSKQSLLTVIQLAIQRFLLLPLYANWWVTQTSANSFAILLTLYVMQMINLGLYTFNINRTENTPGAENITERNANNSTTLHSSKSGEEHIIFLSDLLIPMSFSFLLSLIHSQIVATNTASTSKRRRYSNSNQSSKNQEPRLRRRRRLVKIRNHEGADGVAQVRKPSTIQKINSSAESIVNQIAKASLTKKDNVQSVHIPLNPHNAITVTPYDYAGFNTSPVTGEIKPLHNANAAKMDIPSSGIVSNVGCDCKSTDFISDNQNNSTQRKRNVNWHSPIHDYATETTDCTLSTPMAAVEDRNVDETHDSCSFSNSGCITNQIDNTVREFFDDLINRTNFTSAPHNAYGGAITAPFGNREPENLACHTGILRRQIGEDDGFESLNGKSSSGEETHTPFPKTSVVTENQLRLRLNAGDFPTSVKNRIHESEFQSASGYSVKVPIGFESGNEKTHPQCCDAYQQTKKQQTRLEDASTDQTEEDGDDAETILSPTAACNNSNYQDCSASATEWLGVTTNSEECSYSSEIENSDQYKYHQSDEDMDFTPTIILNPHGITDRLSCTIWDQHEVKKAHMSVLEISSCIIERVESMPESNEYIYFGISFTILLSLIPSFCRLCEATMDSDTAEINYLDVPMLLWEKSSFSLSTIFGFAFGFAQWERIVLIFAFLERLSLTSILFMIFAVAERTFKQRFLYAKLFSHITSSRRARKSNLPHFRLNKVRNIKIWLSVRSYLKKRGPQRSVDVIVSAAFLVTLLLLAFLSVEWLKDSVRLHSHLNLEALLWSTTIGIFVLRFMTLGNKIHNKYRSVSVLITEQINLYLQIEQKPNKKDELMVANSVLKLASDLLKELETPFKISGLSANPLLFTTIKVVILSALSGVLSEILGFKLKLHKIKIK